MKRAFLWLSILLLALLVVFLDELATDEIVREHQDLIKAEAERINSGPLYNLFSGVAHECGLKTTPELYLADNLPFNASYLPYSAAPFHLRAGKIMISKELVNLMDGENLKAVFAHEIGHLKIDGWISLGTFKKEEVAADELVAACVGRDAMVNAHRRCIAIMTADPESLRLNSRQKGSLRRLQLDKDRIVEIIEERIAALLLLNRGR